jgi:NhaP-type Na+/H+ or K+/H+ antiporter
VGRAFVLGAVVSADRPDRRHRDRQAARRAATDCIDIVEGESLVNDGTALVLLRTAIVAACPARSRCGRRGGRLVLNIVGGSPSGLASAT